MAEKNNANLGFEKQIWDAACVLWGHIPAADYRKVIVGLIFLRYVSAAFENKYKELKADEYSDENDKDEYIAENIFFVPEKARWSYVASFSHKAEIGTAIDDAMREIEKENSSLKNVLPKNYGNPDLDKSVLSDVVDIFTNKMDMSDVDRSKDLLGRTYEYCLAKFAENEGVGGGEFYTPHSIVELLVSILKPYENCRIYDPCCGSGGMFVQSEKFLVAHGGRRGAISVYGQEANPDTWKMAKINMAIRGIDANFGSYHADTFSNDLHPTLKADFILANPPFNYNPWGQEKLSDDKRWKYGLPPASNANFAWIQHMLYHLAPNGRIGLVLAKGSLATETGGEDLIREKIIKDDLVEAIISIPTQMFYSTQIPVALWIFSKNKPNKGKTIFIDARKLGYMADRTHKEFSENDINTVVDVIDLYRDGKDPCVDGFCKTVTTEEIQNKRFILNPIRYIGTDEDSIDDEEFVETVNNLKKDITTSYEKISQYTNSFISALDSINLAVFRKNNPEGWQQKRLTEIADYMNGLAMQKYRPTGDDIGFPVLKIKELRQGFVDDDSERCSSLINEKYHIVNGDIIFSWSGSLLVDIWSGGDCGLNQHLFKVTSENYDKWFYFVWTSYYLKHFAAIAADKATTMGHIKREDLNSAYVMVPTSKEYEKMKQLFEPLIKLIVEQRLQQTAVKKMFDILGPKIITGKVNILGDENE